MVNEFTKTSFGNISSSVSDAAFSESSMQCLFPACKASHAYSTIVDRLSKTCHLLLRTIASTIAPKQASDVGLIVHQCSLATVLVSSVANTTTHPEFCGKTDHHTCQALGGQTYKPCTQSDSRFIVGN